MFSLLQNTASSSHVGELNDWNLNFISPPTGRNRGRTDWYGYYKKEWPNFFYIIL